MLHLQINAINKIVPLTSGCAIMVNAYQYQIFVMAILIVQMTVQTNENVIVSKKKVKLM